MISILIVNEKVKIMENNKKFVITLALLTVFAGLSISDAIAISDKSKAQNEIEYTNDVHSVLSLKDCIDIAIQHNPIIRSSIYDEAVYKSKIGQAWSNYFPAISGGLDVSRSMTRYSKEVVFANKKMYNTMGYVPNVSADMLLFDFGKTKASADMAKRMYEMLLRDEELIQKAMAAGLDGDAYSTVREAYDKANSDANPNDLIFVGGSTFVVADLLSSMKMTS